MGDDAPLSRAQELMLAGTRLAGDAPVHNMAWRFDIDGPLDPARFAGAFAAVAAAHDALALVVEDGPDGPRQRRGAPGALSPRTSPLARSATASRPRGWWVSPWSWLW